eukprot:g1581.t1
MSALSGGAGQGKLAQKKAKTSTCSSSSSFSSSSSPYISAPTLTDVALGWSGVFENILITCGDAKTLSRLDRVSKLFHAPTQTTSVQDESGGSSVKHTVSFVEGALRRMSEQAGRGVRGVALPATVAGPPLPNWTQLLLRELWQLIAPGLQEGWYTVHSEPRGEGEALYCSEVDQGLYPQDDEDMVLLTQRNSGEPFEVAKVGPAPPLPPWSSGSDPLVPAMADGAVAISLRMRPPHHALNQSWQRQQQQQQQQQQAGRYWSVVDVNAPAAAHHGGGGSSSSSSSSSTSGSAGTGSPLSSAMGGSRKRKLVVQAVASDISISSGSIFYLEPRRRVVRAKRFRAGEDSDEDEDEEENEEEDEDEDENDNDDLAVDEEQEEETQLSSETAARLLGSASSSAGFAIRSSEGKYLSRRKDDITANTRKAAGKGERFFFHPFLH